MLQRISLVKFLKFSYFCLLYLQVRNNQNMSKKPEVKKIQLGNDDDIQNEILAKCLNFEPSGLGVFDEVSVSKF